MRLYKMELYKLCHKKLFIIGTLCILTFTLLYFVQNIPAKAATSGTDTGWEYFSVNYMLGMVLVSILILCTVSPVFSGETQALVKPLAFTTKEGPAKDIYAKIAASFTVSVFLWLAFSVLILSLYAIAYGWDQDALCRTAYTAMGEMDFQILMQPFVLYIIEVLLISLLALLELCAITLKISAHCRSAFQSVFAATVCWGMPPFALLLYGSILHMVASCNLNEWTHTTFFIVCLIFLLFQCLIYSAPFYLVYEGILLEASVIVTRSEIGPILIILSFACIVLIYCLTGAFCGYRKRPEA